MADENTHGLIIAAAGQTAAGEQTLGTLTLPADGPWIIHDVFGQIVSATATAAEATGGYMRFDAASGDVTPNPAPSKWPVICNGSALGATIDQSGCALQRFPCYGTAPGRATINCVFNNTVAATVAPQIVMGILFGKSVPEPNGSCSATPFAPPPTAQPIPLLALSHSARRQLASLASVAC